jgi:hypothetical protein
MNYKTDCLKKYAPVTVAPIASVTAAALFKFRSSLPQKSRVNPFFILSSTATLISMGAEDGLNWRYGMSEVLTDECSVPEEMAAVIEPIKSYLEIRS